MSISFGGLASGLDTNTMIDQLMAVEAQPQTRLARQQKVVQARSDLMKDIGTRLRAVRTALTTLQSAATWANGQTITNGDPTKFSTLLTAGAAPGAYQVSVTQLARSEQRTYTYSPVSGNKTLSIGSWSLSISNGTPIDTVIANINAASGAPVTAVNVNGQMVLTSKTSGAAGGFSVTGSASGNFTLDAAKTRTGLDATGTTDGIAWSSSTNTVTTAIAGATLNLTQTTSSPVAVNVSVPAIDKDKVTKAVQGFIDSYNSALTFISAKLSERRVPNAASDSDALKGLVFSDSMLSSTLSQLRSGVANTLSGQPSTMDTLGELGITTGATTGSGTINQNSVAGLLTLDTAKLTTALDTDSTSVKRLLAGDSTTTGVSGRLATILDAASGTGGMIDGRVDAASRELSRMNSQQTSLQHRLDAKRASLTAMFAAMEKALSQNQSQSQWLQGQLGGLSSAG
jgi:flagellar hook-associated protein 2